MSAIFIVGMPRSGTTLVQSLISTDDNIYTIPESRFFNSIRFMQKAKPNIIEILASNILANRCFKSATGRFIGLLKSRDQAIKRFDKLMSEQARELGKIHYLEKTPSHLYWVRSIRSNINDSKFIFVTRSPHGTINSYMKAARQWNKSDDEIDFSASLTRWVSDTALSILRCNEVKGIIVSYENLISPDLQDIEIKKLEDFLQVSISKSPEDLKKSAEKITFPWEHWKENNQKGTILGSRSTTNFDRNQESIIIRNLISDIERMSHDT